MLTVHDELPKYLLATLWNTGARINELLALTRGDFSLESPYPFVQLALLKQRMKKQPHQPADSPVSSALQHLVRQPTTLKIPMERRNRRTGRIEKRRSGK
nr:tyrosine-type recombinase/integrase [Escherichia coli]